MSPSHWQGPSHLLGFPSERYAALWGVETPTNRFCCQPEWHELLDPCGRGACGACPGFPKLKVTGTVFVRFSNSPITKSRSKMRGRTAASLGGKHG